MTDDFDALQALAADNARLCTIALAADKLAKAARDLLLDNGYAARRRIQEALDAYKVVRNGT